MSVIDWAIVFAVLAALIAGVLHSRHHMQSVADFLAAGRTAGRYLLTVSQGVSELGAISMVAWLEMHYVAGLPQTWWGLTMALVVMIVTVSGWVIYRFRQTRCLTLAEFFERRYSRRFRVFAGMVACFAGLINFGIFPAVGARFFIYYCELPQQLQLGGVAVSTFPLLMIVLLSISLCFVFAGGQIAVLIADFLQGTFINVVFVVISVYLMWKVPWSDVYQGLIVAPENASVLNPFRTSHVEDFNLGYFLIGVVGVIYGTMSWQGTQAYNASARSAHEARMGQVLNNWRWFPRTLLLLVVPLLAYAVMHNGLFAEQAADVNAVLAGVESETLQNQLRVPLVLKGFLPVGLVGAFAAVMLAAFISTHDTYLHSWGSILVQDVILPLRDRPLDEKQHLLWLRISIVFVALFIFTFSLIFQQTQYIFLFFAVTGAIFAGGSGAVIIGGLYWRRGTTAAAWTAMLLGSSIAVAGVVVHQVRPGFFINGQVFWLLAMIGAALSYVVVSLLGRAEPFDLDRLLHRGKYGLEDGPPARPGATERLRWLGMGPEATRGDRVILGATYGWTLLWTGVFLVGTVYNLTHDVPDESWGAFWRFYLIVLAFAAFGVVVWFSIGGYKNLRTMLADLRTMRRDPRDDGWVRQESE